MGLVTLAGAFGIFLSLNSFQNAPGNAGSLSAAYYEGIQKSLQGCGEQETEGSKIQCWEEVIKLVLEREGLAAAFGILVDLYSTGEPHFITNCHDFTHVLGEEAYYKFINGEEFDVVPETAFCSFGFYHGFMELLADIHGDVSMARDFCAYVDEQLFDKAPDATYSCFHGIGHGWANQHENSGWGNELSISEPSLELCDRVAIDPASLFRCATGVFDSISYDYYNGLYGLEMNPEDPLWLCRVQEERFRKACYSDLMPALIWFVDQKLENVGRYIAEIPEDQYALHAMRRFAGNSVRFLEDRSDYASEIWTCRSFQERLRISCIIGLGEGHMEFGPPGEGHIDGLRFCRSEFLGESERGQCIAAILSYSNQIYAKEKVLNICSKVDERYHGDSCEPV